MGNYLKISQDPYRNMIHFEPNMEEAFNSMDDDELFDYAFSQMGGPESLASMHFKQVARPNYAAIAIGELDNPTDAERTALYRFFSGDSASTKGMKKESVRVLRKVLYKMEFKKIEMTTTAQEDASWEKLFGKEE